MKKILSATFAVVILSVIFLSFKPKADQTASVRSGSFKIIGYLTPNGLDADAVPYQYLTHINYAFVVPLKEADGTLSQMPNPDFLKSVVQKAHQHGVKVFISIGGWNIGDGGGNDTRFEELAGKAEARKRFTQQALNLVLEYDLDGVDIDWEYPDPIELSSTNYVLLMQELKEALHAKGKKLSAAIVSYHDLHGYGITKPIFKIADWLNIMAYDDDYNTFDGRPVPHSPYWLDVRAFDYWINDRGLSKEKAIMGVPFYGKGKKGGFAYNQLLKQGANPEADVQDSIYYNGIKTMKEKTRLALKRGGGIMIWELKQDATGDNSLLKAINDVVDGKN